MSEALEVIDPWEVPTCGLCYGEWSKVDHGVIMKIKGRPTRVCSDCMRQKKFSGRK